MYMDILSFLLGLIISIILFKILQKRRCIILDNTNLDNLTKKVHSYQGKCYKYNKKEVSC